MRGRGLVVLLLLLAARPAAADPLDEFGLGATAAGTAGARTASAHGAEAAHHNPAGIALEEDPTVLLAYGYGAMRLGINGRDAEVLDARGTSLAVAVPIALGGGVALGVGLALYLPDQFVARIQQIPPTEPHFILLDNDPHRLVAEPVAALRLSEWLSLGAGASVLGDARGNGITFNVGVIGGEKVGEAALDAALPTRVAPILGVMVAPGKRVRGGATWRGELGLDLALDILANVDVAGVVTGDALVSVRADNYFTPARLTGGIAADVTPELTLSGDVVWSRWSRFGSGLADLRVIVSLDITPPLVQTEVPPSAFEDTVALRLGAEYRHGRNGDGERLHWAVRGGWAYLPTPVPEQTGLTSFADNDRQIFALGAGLTLADFAPILTRPIELGAAVQWHQLSGRLTVKDSQDFPGAAFSSDGSIVHANLTATVTF
jgi:long-chain fatty acid transport protein